MFSFGRKKKFNDNEESIKEIEDIVERLNKDGNGRIRIIDLERALQHIDEDKKSKPEIKKQVRKFRE
jgi:hypothetical protein